MVSSNAFDEDLETMWISDLMQPGSIGWVQIELDHKIHIQGVVVTFPDTSSWSTKWCIYSSNAVPREFTISVSLDGLIFDDLTTISDLSCLAGTQFDVSTDLTAIEPPERRLARWVRVSAAADNSCRLNCSRGNIFGIVEVELIYGGPEPVPEPEPDLVPGEPEVLPKPEPEPEPGSSGSWDFSGSGFLYDETELASQLPEPDSGPVRVPDPEPEPEPEPEEVWIQPLPFIASFCTP